MYSYIGNISSKRNIWKCCVNTKWNMRKGIYGHSEAASPFQGLIPPSPDPRACALGFAAPRFQRFKINNGLV